MTQLGKTITPTQCFLDCVAENRDNADNHCHSNTLAFDGIWQSSPSNHREHNKSLRFLFAQMQKRECRHHHRSYQNNFGEVISVKKSCILVLQKPGGGYSMDRQTLINSPKGTFGVVKPKSNEMFIVSKYHTRPRCVKPPPFLLIQVSVHAK